MSNITASMVKELREKTGSGMMDCKKALEECSGDISSAVDWLRTKGLSAAGKKSSRVTAEGLVSTFVSGLDGVILELNSETDFVAKNEKFQELARVLSESFMIFKGDLESFKASALAGHTVQEEIAEKIAVIGENINLRRAVRISVSQGLVASYTHNSVVPDMGKIGVLVAIESSSSATDKLLDLGKKIAMHIAASRPESLSISELDAKLIEKEKNIFREQAVASGKPDAVIDKMVDGRIRKYYEEVVLLEQIFVMDGKTKISQLLEDASRDLRADVKIKQFVRYTLGEGIEKEEYDFAKEVESVLKV